MLIKNPIWHKRKTEQPLPHVCNDHLPHVLLDFSLRVSTITQEPYDIFVLHPYQTTDLLVEVLLVHIECLVQPFHGDSPILKYSLQLQRCLILA